MDLSVGAWYPVKVVATFSVVMLTALAYRRTHEFARFGPANYVTTIRAALVSVVAGLIGESVSAARAEVATVAAVIIAALDGVDGWLARRSGMESRFGARFDLEVDALLIMVLAILALEYGKAGPWVLLSGLLRYGFVAAGWWWPWLRAPLAPSRRRQTICVVQVVGLILTVAPVVTPPLSAPIAAAALAALSYSFFVDTLWLWQRKGVGWVFTAKVKTHPTPFSLAAALLLLDASLTFENAWPTPGILWRGELSIELAALLLLLIALARRPASPRPSLLRGLSIVWSLLTLGRYADVTAPALYGRDVNLYWDLRYMPDVAAMLTRAAPAWLLIFAGAAAVLAVLVLYSSMRWAIGRVGVAATLPRQRIALIVVALLILAGFAVQTVTRRAPAGFETEGTPWFPAPVLDSYARQAGLALAAVTRSVPLPPSPPMTSDLSLVKDADVLLIFIESYGAVTFERPEFTAALAPWRAELESAVLATHRDIASAFVQSPTFGGSSWLAHISLLSGIEVRDPHTNAQLMTEQRDTMATSFARRGFRTVAWMPGLRQAWPEGRFYGFDEIYNAGRLDYQGPEFGWFAIPDQFSIARLDELELSRVSRPPLFVFFPTLSTHVPFGPTPLYQPDWPRMLTDKPFTPAQIVAAYATEPDYVDFGPGYERAVAYALQTIAGYLRYRADRDFVMILLGDHQPPALVSGEGAPWDVPVHVIASRPAVIDRLIAHGFRRGVRPGRPSLGHMHTLLPVLFDAFGNQ